MKKKLLAILLTVCMVISMAPAALAAGTNPFTDVDVDDWYYDEVQYVYENDLMKGTSTTTFSPDVTVNRAMMVTILYRLEGAPAVSTTGSFTDVPAGQYYTDAVEWAKENKITAGYGGGLFGPNDLLTREQMATFFYRYAEFKDYDVSASTDLSGYTDLATVGSYALDAFKWTNATGLIKGTTTTTLSPKGDATRGQLSVILYRFCENVVADAVETHTVTFDYNYSNKGTYTTVSVEDGSKVEKPSNPTRSSYSFSGWYTKASGGSKFDFDTAVTADLTLYARWSYNGGGGGGSSHSHSWSAGTPVPPTCTTEGYTPYTCVCGASKNDDVVPAVSHVAGEKCTHCGVTEVATAEQLAAALSADDENIHVVLMNNIDLPITSLGSQTPGSGEYKLGGENTKDITINLNDKKLNITTTYWSAIGAKNNDATITVKNGTMTSTGNSASTWNAYDVRFCNCNYVIEDVTFEKSVALDNAGKTTVMNKVTINDTCSNDVYGLWITAEGQSVTLKNCTIDTTGATDGRGIKIDEQYVAAPAKVTLNVSDTTFKTEEKSAILVKSAAGADITLSNVDISSVVADTVNEVWVDEDAAAYQQLVTVIGGNKILEGAVVKIGDVYYKTLADAITAAQNGDTVTLLENGTYTMVSANVDVTITGTKETKIELPYGALSGSDNTIIFDGVTIMGETNSAWYSTLFNGAKKVIYKNCDIYNQLTTYCDSEFINCKFYNTFDNDYSVYCYSGSDIKFDGCSFDSKCSKAIKVYDEGNGGRNVYVNNCSFTTETADKKAAVEIDSTHSTYHIYFTGENTISGKYTKLWNSDPGEDQGTNVYIDDILQKLATTQDALNSAVSGSGTEVEVTLAAGTYTMPTTSGDVTISGTEATVISGNDCTASNVTFNGVTIQSTGASYTGIKHSDEVVYNGVTIKGNMYLYAKKVVFNNCTFDLSATNDYIWVYGATSVEFNNCTFNTMGKAILVFQDGSNVDQTVKVEGCTFNASAPAYNWNQTIHISAVSIDGSQGGTYNVILNNNTVDTDFNGLWQDKTNAGNITVTVDGTTALTPNP